MPETITPAWLEACGFKKQVGGWILSEETQRRYIVVFHTEREWGAGLHSGPAGNSSIFGCDKSRIRSAWHALTGTRLSEPMPEDIAESTLILADKYEDEGFCDQAAYIREAVRFIPKKCKSCGGMALTFQDALMNSNVCSCVEVTAIDSTGVIFADGSATAGTPVYECVHCRRRRTTAGLCHCDPPANPRHFVPIGVGSGEGHPIVSQGTILSHIYDQLPPEFQRMFTRDESERTRAGVFNRNTGQHSPRPRFANDSYRFRYCEQCRGCTQHVFLSQRETPAFYECNSCHKSGYVAPVDAIRRVPMIRDEAGWRPCRAGEAASGYATAGELEDALNHGRTSAPIRPLRPPPDQVHHMGG